MLIGALACACILGGPAGFFCSGLMGSRSEAGASQSATLGLVPVVLGCIMSLLLLSPASMRTAARLGPSVVLSSGARSVLALAGGIVIYLVMKPDGTAYFAALLTSAILCLAVESAWGISALKKVSHHGTHTA